MGSVEFGSKPENLVSIEHWKPENQASVESWKLVNMVSESVEYSNWKLVSVENFIGKPKTWFPLCAGNPKPGPSRVLET